MAIAFLHPEIGRAPLKKNPIPGETGVTSIITLEEYRGADTK